MEEKLHRAKHLDAMTHMSATLVNDFNNILSVILIKLQSLEWPLRHDESMLQQINDARDAVFRGVSHMNRLSSFSRLEPYVPENIDLNQCITKRGALLSDVAGRGCEVITKLATNTLPVCIDPLDLEMALINLLANAREAMSGGGSITIGTENSVIEEGDYAENDAGPGNYVVLSITDIGVGMSEKERQYATEPHFSTKPDAAGHGFGLSTVFSFVRQSSGFMHINSEQGSGTCVKLFLPAVSATTETIVESVDPLTVLTKSESVLVIDGDAGVREAMATQLKELGYTPLQAGSPVQALEMLEAHPETEVVLMDIFLSDNIDCATLAKEIIDTQPGIRVLYTSAHARTAFKHIGVPDGVEDVLFKPYRRSKLAEKLRELLDDKVEEPALV